MFRTKHGFTLQSSEKIKFPLNLIQELMNEKLSNKLKLQLSDPLATASGTLPEWCHSLAALCPPAFPLDLRFSLLAATAFGVDRAVASLQIAHDRSPQRVSLQLIWNVSTGT